MKAKLKFLQKLMVVALLLCWVSCHSQSIYHAKPQRMEGRIQELSRFGANPQSGVSRVAFSEADRQGRAYIIRLMKEAGLEVRIDAASNIIGYRKGRNPKLPVIAFGSHIDSVPMGGNYDGDVGVIGAIECIELLNENKIQTEHPLEVIVFTNEEGGLTGSTAMTSHLTEADLSRVTQSGKTIKEGIAFLGGRVNDLSSAVRRKEEIKAFVELHIEQGAILYNERINIGIVEGIVGIEWWDVTLEGKANHAGTTPMNLRKDALLAASKLVLAINETVRSFAGAQVGTVGRINAEPGAPNVIPGKVVMSLELRDLSREKIFAVFEKIQQRAQEISKEYDVQISFRSLNSNIPAMTDKKIQDLIGTSAKELGFTSKTMPSGAGHDTQDMAKLFPSAMIFVPSKDGISHAPQEFTLPQDMANGASVLLRTILKLDREK